MTAVSRSGKGSQPGVVIETAGRQMRDSMALAHQGRARPRHGVDVLAHLSQLDCRQHHGVGFGIDEGRAQPLQRLQVAGVVCRRLEFSHVHQRAKASRCCLPGALAAPKVIDWRKAKRVRLAESGFPAA